MNLDHKQIWPALLITIFMLFCLPVVFPAWHLMVFAPFLVILFYKKPFFTCLLTALACGFVMDLLSSYSRLGLYAMTYFMTTWLIFKLRRHFFADRLTTLPIMTFFFSVLATVFHFSVVYALEGELAITWKWMFTDLVYMPAVDALYAFVVFILPAFCFGKRQRRGKEYFMEG